MRNRVSQRRLRKTELNGLERLACLCANPHDNQLQNKYVESGVGPMVDRGASPRISTKKVVSWDTTFFLWAGPCTQGCCIRHSKLSLRFLAYIIKKVFSQILKKDFLAHFL